MGQRDRFSRLKADERTNLADMLRTARLEYQARRKEQLQAAGPETPETRTLHGLDEQARLFLVELEGE